MIGISQKPERLSPASGPCDGILGLRLVEREIAAAYEHMFADTSDGNDGNLARQRLTLDLFRGGVVAAREVLVLKAIRVRFPPPE